MRRRRKIRLIISIAGILLLALASGIIIHYAGSGGGDDGETGTPPTLYHCPMHPNYISEEPGSCPICGMDLVPIEEDGGEGEETGGMEGMEGMEETGPMTIRFTPEEVRLIGITTVPVERRNLSREIRTIGIVKEDEERISHVHTRFEGWIERLHVDVTGEYVRAGEPLLEIYSPQLVSTEREYLLALEAEERLSGSEFSDVSSAGSRLLDATRERLRLFEISDDQIEELERTREVRRTLTLLAPASGIVMEKNALEGMRVGPGTNLYTIADLSRVWVQADIYENEIGLVQEGQPAVLTLTAVPGRTFHGNVDYVYPYLHENTRTNRVRLTIPNTDGVLRPGMYANVVLSVSGGSSLALPLDAVMNTGERTLAYVGVGEGRYEMREVEIGRTIGDYYEILSGLSEGERVVERANFFVDSEASLRMSASGMSGHNH